MNLPVARVAFRVDATTGRGLGHLVRCLALADELVAFGADVRVVSRAEDVPLAAWFESRPAVVPVALPAGPVSALDDARATVAALDGWRPDWIVVDDYGLDARWHAEARRASGARIAAIDDLADRPLDVDMLVDHNLRDDTTGRYDAVLVRPPARRLLGPRHALIRAAFRDAPRWREPAEPSVGIFLGGTDPGGASRRVLASIRADGGFRGPVEIVTTSANPDLGALRAAVAGDVACRLAVDLPDLSAFHARHALQVGAGGGATWERCCIGVPTLALVLAENQRAAVPALAARGVVAVHDVLADGYGGLGAAVAGLLGDPQRRRCMSEASRALVDGVGALRVALAMCADRVQARPARPQDARRLFDWRNHPATRAVSRSSAEIDWEGHRRWVDAVLKDPDRRLLVGWVGARPVGVVRLDLDRASGDVEVSLYLDPTLHGLGLGAPMLADAQRGWIAGDGRGHRFVATVLPGNTASRRLFESLGYHCNEGRYERPLDDERKVTP